jgi:hypothetical protein
MMLQLSQSHKKGIHLLLSYLGLDPNKLLSVTVQCVQEHYPVGDMWGASRRGGEQEEEPLCQVEP